MNVHVSEVGGGGGDAMALQQRQPPVRYSDEINDKLIKWMNETGYSIVQINGQRISSSPRLDRKPSRDCEVFVGKIPRDCYEDELFPVFQSAGHILELRLMMMFSGTNRGYAFVMYERLEDAQRAVDHLDNYEIRRGHRVGVLPCVNNCRLFIGCFQPEERYEVRMQEVLRTETEHVQSVARRCGRGGRWYLLVEYLNHRAAAIARRELTPRRVQLFGPHVIVDWEIPMDKRGHRIGGQDERRALRGPAIMKLSRPIIYCHPETKASGKSKMLMERGAPTKCGRQLMVSRQPQAVPQCGPYQDVWIPKQTPPQQPSYWPTDILQIHGLNQSPGSCSEWNSATPTVRRPLTRQSSLENSTKSSFSQESDCSNFHSCLYRQLVTGSQQNLRRTGDSGLYSDPDGRRPFSSDGSTGSARSSFSMSAGSCVSNWDSSTEGTSSTAAGSTNNSCAVSWDRSLSSDMDSNRETGSQLLFKKEFQTPGSHPLMWHMEDQQAYFSPDLCKNGIWSTRFKSPEDHQLIDDLFMKETEAMPITNADQDVHLSFHSLSLSRDDDISKKNFDRAIQPPQPRNSQQGSLNPSNFRTGF